MPTSTESWSSLVVVQLARSRIGTITTMALKKYPYTSSIQATIYFARD
jgi:hypothetical protein